MLVGVLQWVETVFILSGPPSKAALTVGGKKYRFGINCKHTLGLTYLDDDEWAALPPYLKTIGQVWCTEM